MEKTISKKNDGEIETKRSMFAPIVFATDEETRAAGIVPDPALNEEDGVGCEAVFEDE
jgi:hypothetical protein